MITLPDILLTLLFGVFLAIAVGLHRALGRRESRVPMLTQQSPRYQGGEPPLVSVLIPVKDEEDAIAGCLDSVLAFHYPNLEVLVVNDRSSDRTAEIVREYAARDDRVQLFHVTDLPEGWAGKTHALHQAVPHARGEWLLFVDADTRHDPDLVRILLEDCEQNNIEFASIVPGMIRASFWEKLLQPLAGALYFLLVPLYRANDPAQKERGYANGQIMLLRNSAYEQIGGHAAVRHQLVEDVNMGRRARRLGVGLKVSMAPELTTVRMYSSLAEIVRGWTRIIVTTVDFESKRVWKLALRFFIMSWLPHIALLIAVGMLLGTGVRPGTLLLLGLAIALEILHGLFFHRIYRKGRVADGWQVLRPLADVMMTVVIVNSLWLCRTKRLKWRGTEYDARFHADSEPDGPLPPTSLLIPDATETRHAAVPH